MSENHPAFEAWTAAIELLRAENRLSDSQTAFVRMAHPLAAVDDVFLISVASDFIKSWIDEHASAAMTDKLTDILGRTVRIIISVDPTLGESRAPSAESADPAPTSPRLSSVPEEVSRPYEHHPSAGLAEVGSAPSAPSASLGADIRLTSVPSESSAPEADFSSSSDDAPATPSMHVPRGAAGDDPVHNAAGLNPKYVFESFVTGESNRFASATSFAVAEGPGGSYNPLFLYGDSGMGKTHLMHAIGNYALNLFKGFKVRYVSSEEFTNEFINSVRDETLPAFKDRFRKVDILLIDDIQFIGDRERTVQEFFHTFNALVMANKQIVISSDVAPNLLQGFEERMISRFASGITANISPPDFETRIAILEKKASFDHLDIPREVNEFIASKMTTNVREMEGALHRVTAFADISKQPIDVSLAQMVLKDLLGHDKAVEITSGLIIAQTASYFGVSIDELSSADRSRTLVSARQIAMYLCRELTELSLPKIGHLFGGRDHTTVMHANKKITKLMSEREQVYNQVSDLTTRIKQAAAKAAQ